MTTSVSSSRAGLGAVYAFVATFFFSINDSAIKFLSGDYALHQVVLVRSLIALVVLFVLVVPFAGGFSVLKTKRLAMHLLRGACVVFANLTFFLGLSVMPLADTVAVFFISPLLITAFSVIFLGEKTGPRRWAAVGAGMVGVIIMLRPGAESFQPALFLPLLAATFYAFLHVLTRKIGGTESAATLSIYIQIVFVVISGAIGLALGHGNFAGGGGMFEFVLRGWSMPSGVDMWVLVLLGVSSAAGSFLISQAYRISEASVIAPMEYIAVPLAVLLGYLFFDEIPDNQAWLGMLLIVGAGLFAVWRDAVAGRAAPPHPRARR